MLCPQCFTPLSPASSACPHCGRPATRLSDDRRYSLAMAATLMRPDTQPELPVSSSALVPTPAISSSRYETVRLWADSLIRSGSAAARKNAAQIRPAAQPYTLAHLVADTFGRNASPAVLARGAEESRMQRLLSQVLGARLGVTKWASALTGGGVAMGFALALALVVQLVWNALLGTLAPGLSDPVTAFVERALSAVLGGSPVKLLALANLVPLQLVGATSSVPGTGQLQLTPPLSGLLLIPMVALIFGGALSAASDCTGRARYSIARGALVGPVYAALLSLLTALGGVHLDGATFGLGGTPTLLADPRLTLCAGLLWGTLFGALGGWVRLYGRRSLAELVARLARITRFRRLVGSVVGAAVTLAYGLGGSLALAIAGLVVLLASGHAPSLLASAAQASHLGGTPQGILGFALLVLTLVPSLAIWVFVYASGGSLDADYVTHASAGNTGIAFSTFALSGGSPASSPALYLLALLPIVCCFVGGRAAARFARADSRGAGFLAGALVVLPLALFALVLAMLATFSLQAHLPAGTLMLDVAPSALGGLPQLIVAVVVAGLGGRSTVAPGTVKRVETPAATASVTPAGDGASQSAESLVRGR